MTQHPSPIVQAVSERVANHMDAILKEFKSGSKITVIVRQADDPDGRRDFVLSNDTLDGGIAVLRRRKGPDTLRGDV